jgi:hypothetical protein
MLEGNGFTESDSCACDYPLSMVQQDVWPDQILNPDSPHHNIGPAVRGNDQSRSI